MTMMRCSTALAALAVSACASGVSAQEVTWRFSNWVPSTHILTTDMFEPWAEDVEEATEGRVKIQFMPALGAPQAHFDLVRNGVADIAFGVHSYSPERFKLTEFVELPFTAENALVNSISYWRTYEEFFLEAGEHEGTHLLGLWVPGSYQLFTKDGPETVSDLDGLRIRVPGTLVERIASTLGMVSISSPLTEAYDQISRGIIDGMFQNYSTVVDYNMTEHMPTLFSVPGGFSASSQFLVVNQKSWDALSEEDRQAIDALSGEAMVERFTAIWQEDNANTLGELTDAGVQHIALEGDELETVREAVAPLESAWIEEASEKGVEAAEALEFYRSQLDTVSEDLGVPKN